MNHDTSKNNGTYYTLQPTYTPLKSSGTSNEKNTSSQTKKNTCRTKKTTENSTHQTEFPNTIIRSANEDDDLYDPYSDYHDGTLQAVEFERDPWR